MTEAGVESGVDGAEAQDMGFGAAGGGAAQAGTELAQGRIAVLPEVSGRVVAVGTKISGVAGPSRERGGVRGRLRIARVALRFPPSGRQWLRCTQVQRQRLAKPLCASVRWRCWASSRWVMWAMRLMCVPVACRCWCIIERGEIATIPGAAEQRRKVSVGALQVVENGGELFGEREEAAVGGRLLIAQSMDEAAGVRRAVVTRVESQGWSTSAKRRAIWFQLVPLRALLESPTSTTKRLRPWRVASTMQWGPRPTRLPKTARSWRRMAAGWASV